MWNIRAVYREKWIPADGLRAKPAVAHTLPCPAASPSKYPGFPKAAGAKAVTDREGHG